MPVKNYYHILCTSGDKIIYEGRFQCISRKAAMNLLREKIGRQNLSGLTYTITEFPIDIMKELIESIIKNKPFKEGDVIPRDKSKKLPTDDFGMIQDYKRNPNAPRGVGSTKRRLGDY